MKTAKELNVISKCSPAKIREIMNRHAPLVEKDENGGHRLVEPDYETSLALADAPRSLRNYVAALRAEREAIVAALGQGEKHDNQD